MNAKSALPILVIEDEPSVMAFISTALEKYGYQVVGSETCARALELLKAGDFGGVISDMRTPGGVDGAHVHAWLAAHRPRLARRLLFISGDTVNEDTAATLQLTGAPFIEKPFRVQQLMQALEAVLSGSDD